MEQSLENNSTPPQLHELVEIVRLENLVDQAIEIDQKMKEYKKELDSIKAQLTEAAFADMENKNLKYLQIFGDNGNFNIAYKEKFEIDNYRKLVDILGEVAMAKISRKEEIKYDTDNNFKAALIALYKGEYSNELTITDVLKNMGFDDKAIKATAKKLKGDYIKDKATLESAGATGDLEEELYSIKLYKNYELVNRFFGGLSSEELDQVKKTIFVEDNISVGFEYEK